jgi:hypothetical protein
MSLAHTEETVGEFMIRSQGASLLNIKENVGQDGLSNDETGLLSSKVVDVPSQQT